MFAYMGGKTQHIKYLDRIFPKSSKSMVDVFGGAGWVSLKTQHHAENRIYNDINPWLASAFSCFKTEPDRIKDLLTAWPHHNAELYRQFQKDIFGQQSVEIDTLSTAKFLYLQTQTFSGNTLGLTSSVYFNKLKSPQTVINKLNKPHIIERLQSLSVENKDFSHILNEYDSEDTFFYLDPPYYKLEHYYTSVFAHSQHAVLAKMLSRLRGRFALSYYFFPELEQWFPRNKFNHHTYTLVKTSSSAKNKSIGTELVITNY